MVQIAENIEFDSYLKQMLDQIPDNLDKREDGPIYTVLAPVAFLLAEQNYMLAYLTNLLYPDTAEGEWLDRILQDFGITRDAATYSLREIHTFDGDGNPLDVPIGSLFAIEDIAFKVTEKIDTGKFKAACEQSGTKGNDVIGTILPTDNITGLGNAVLTDQPLIPARDEETDDDLRARFFYAVQRVAFGGNIADYETKAMEIDGVGAVKVFPSSSFNPAEPGRVGIVIGDEQGKTATTELVNKVSAEMGVDGDGIAPIGHTVTVATSHDLSINVRASIKLRTGTSFDIVKPVVDESIRLYIDSIEFTDETIFLAKLMANILNCDPSIMDVTSVTINGIAGNLALNKTYAGYQVPVIGTITVTEVT